MLDGKTDLLNFDKFNKIGFSVLYSVPTSVAQFLPQFLKKMCFFEIYSVAMDRMKCIWIYFIKIFEPVSLCDLCVLQPGRILISGIIVCPCHS